MESKNELFNVEFTVIESKEDLIKAVDILNFLRDNFGNYDVIADKAIELLDNDHDQIGTCAFIDQYINSLDSNKTHDYLATMFALDQKRDLKYLSYAYPVGGFSEFRGSNMHKLWTNKDRLAYINSNIKYLTEIINNYDTNLKYNFPSKTSK